MAEIRNNLFIGQKVWVNTGDKVFEAEIVKIIKGIWISQKDESCKDCIGYYINDHIYPCFAEHELYLTKEEAERGRD